jgi:Cys-tRNA(Pro) deacylase
LSISEAGRRLTDSVPGFDFDIHHFPEGTKTAVDAAAAIGCPVAAIVKSLVFVVVHDDGSEEATVSLIPGDRTLDTSALADAAGGNSARRASLDEVRDATGYAAGGTPPFGHDNRVRIFADPSLRRNDPVWAAGGTPDTVFPISPVDLDRLSNPIWADITNQTTDS